MSELLAITFFRIAECRSFLLGIRFEHRFGAVSSGDLLQHVMNGLNFIRKIELFYTFISMTFFNSVFGMSYSTAVVVVQ